MANSKEKFDELGVTVLAASTDTVFSHRAWVKHEGLMKNFPYLMLADHGLDVASAYNILDEKSGIAFLSGEAAPDFRYQQTDIVIHPHMWADISGGGRKASEVSEDEAHQRSVEVSGGE